MTFRTTCGRGERRMGEGEVGDGEGENLGVLGGF